MKRIFFVLALLAAASAAGATPYGDFKNQVTAADLKPFALDLGGVLGGTAFHSGRALGMPGFDVGVVGTIQFRPDRNDLILRNGKVQRFGIPMIQAEVGLPLNFDVIAHGSSGAGASVFGGGLRYGLHKSDKLSPLPDLAVSFFGDRLNQTFFSATHYSANATVSMGLPVFKPYIGLGWDYTSVKVGAATAAGLVGATASARGTRLTGGVDISPLPLLHIYGAYSLLHGISGADLGLGVRF